MMPPKTTFEDIKAHQRKVEKDKITPDNLSPCPRCRVGSEFFKIHAYCERRFLNYYRDVNQSGLLQPGSV